MRVVVYNIQDFEKETLAKANAKVHDLTLISNPLNLETLRYAVGKEVVIISHKDILDREILDALHNINVNKIITRSSTMHHIDMDYAKKLKFHVANTPDSDTSLESVAQQTIKNLTLWTQNECLGSSCQCGFSCNKDKTL